MIEVIIPVGPGHQGTVDRAVQSVHVAVDNYAWEPVRIKAVDDTDGKMGRSAARNHAVKNSTADWIFFLDADDMMHPEAFETAKPHIDDYSAIWGSCWELNHGMLHRRYELPTIRTYKTLIKHDPYLTVKIGHFIRRETAQEFPFAENMNTGEDWDYYLRVWQSVPCIKVAGPMYIKIAGEHSTGPKSATGADWNQSVNKQLEQARAEFAA